MSKEFIRPEQFCHIHAKTAEEAVNLQLTEEQIAELARLYDGTLQSYEPGNIIKGTVTRVDSDGVLVDIGFKSRGLIPKYEFGDHELKQLKPGAEIEVMIDTLESPEGEVVLSYEKAKAARAWNEIMRLFEADKPVQGVVTHKVKGGLNVDIGIPAFLPGSQIDLQRVTDFDQFVGQTITAKILKVNQKRGNVIVSRRKYLYDQRSDSRKKILDTLSENQIIQGQVKNITNYGVFIDIGGVDGLLHITDMTWGRIAHPSELVKIGDPLTVKVLSFDKDSEKISLGLKQLTDNPWAKLTESIKAGEKIKGKVSSITDYGLFVEVAPGIEGLVHISEISWTDRINDLQNRYKVGQDIDVYVVSVDKDNRRMSLSIKQLEKNPWDAIEERFKPGDRIKGPISNITDFGIFVQLMPGIDGLVHISDLSWTEHIDHPGARYKVGDEVEAVVLSVDKENKKVSLGIKQLELDPWDRVEELYPVGSIVEGVVSKIASFGAFVRLDSGIEGLIHNTTIAEDEDGKKAEDVLKVDEKRKFRVINLNKKERKIAFSTKLEGEIKKAASEDKRKAAPSKPRERKDALTSATSGTKVKSSLQMALESMQEEANTEEE